MNTKSPVVLLTMLGALTALSIDIYLPSMPAIADDLGTSLSRIQWTLSIFLLSFGVGQLIYGPLSDRFGRKPPLLWGLGLYLVANLICALAPDGTTLVLGRFLQGLGACCGAVSSIAITRDLFSGQAMTRTLAKMATATSLAPILAPILGAWFDHFLGWRSSFGFLALVAAGLLWACAAGLPETARPTRVRRLGYRHMILGDGAFRDYCLLSGFAFAALFVFISTASPILMGHFGLSPKTFAILFASNALMYLLGSHTAGKLSGRLSLPQMALVGSSLILGGGLVMGVAGGHHPLAVLLPMFMVTFGVAIATPAGASGAMAGFGDKAGGASALHGFLRFALAGFMGWLIGLQEANSGRLALTIAVCGLACVLVGMSRAMAAKRTQVAASF